MLLDTLQPGLDSGSFCAARRQWLRDTLVAAGERQVILFQHHPPMPLGLTMQDHDRMIDGEAFLAELENFDNVAYLCIGHVHRPITGTIRGIPFAAMRSVLYQAPAPQPAWDWNSFLPAKEAPNIGVISLGSPAGITIQYEQFCAYSIGT